jgi:CHAD domain-containing protein
MNPVAGSLEQQWKRYRKALKRCQREFSPKAIHEFRVETRRLLSRLELLGGFLPAQPLDKVRRLLKRHLDLLDDLRDTQVLLVTLARMRRRSSAAQLFRASLLKREQRCVRRAHKQIQKVRTRRLGKLVAECREELEKRLADFTPRKTRAALLRSVHRAFRRAGRLRARVSPQDTATIHRTRVAFKKFRYMVEALVECLPGVTRERLAAMRRYQTMMGNIQDSAVLLAALDRFLLEDEVSLESARGFRAQLVRRRRRLIRTYLAAADQLFGFWPLPDSGAGVPPAVSAPLPATTHTQPPPQASSL